MPGHSKPHVHFGPVTTQHHENSHNRRSEDVALLRFPNAKNILWDHTSIGSPVNVSLSYYRKPKLCISEKVIRLAQRHLESLKEENGSCALQGSLSVDEDGEGLTIVLDRFDPGGGGPISINGLTPGDISVPFQMAGNSKSDRGSSMDDYLNALKLLRGTCCSKERIELSSFLLTKGWCNYYTNGEKSVHHLEFDVVTMATEFTVSPISPVPIVPTALSKNLSGPMSLSHLQGEPKTGYLTMDHTRKVLLVLESDPKVFSLPLVGIWISGLPYVYSPFAWACFLRFLHNTSIQDRVCSPPEPFLMVLYSPVHSKPEFYEVSVASGSSKMEFDLYSGYEVVSLPKMATCSSQNAIEFELTAAESGKKRDLFDGATHQFDSLLGTSQTEDLSPAAASDEITPRSKPAPHKSQVPKVQPMVPEVSLLFGEDGQSGIFTNLGPRKPPITQGRPNGMHHVNDFSSTPSQSSIPHSVPSSHSLVPVLSNGNPTQTTRLSYHTNSAPDLQQYPTQTVCNGPCCVSKPGPAQPYIQNSLPHHGAALRHSTPYTPQTHPSHVRHSLETPIHHTSVGQSVQRSLHPVSSAPNLVPHHHPYPQSGGIVNTPAQHQQVLPRHRYPTPCACSDCQFSASSNGHVRSYSGPAPQHVYHRGSQQVQKRRGHSQHTPQPQGLAVSRNSLPSGNPQQTLTGHKSINISQQNGNAGPATYPSPQMNFPAVTSNEVVKPANSLSPRNSSSESGNSRSSGQADSTGRSSDDSGLSVTPERPKGSVIQDSEQQPSGNSEAPSQLGAGINWSQVPPEVHQLLLQQDAQLKQLQAQIQLLIQNQSASTQCTTTTDLNSTVVSEKTADSNFGKNKTVEENSHTCTVGTNTSVFSPPGHEMHSMSVQTSPRKRQISPREDTTSRSGSVEDPPSSQRYSDERSSISQHSQASQQSQCSSGGGDGRTPAEIRHRGVLPMNSTEREDFDMEMSQGDFLGVASNVELHNATMNSIQSDMIVDMPSYHSSPTRSQSSPTATGSGEFSMNSRSPISASMCGDGAPDSDDSDTEEGEGQNEEGEGQLSADDKEYYDKLMNNIHRLLHQTEDTGGEDTGLAESLPQDSVQQSILLGQYLNSMRMDSGEQNPVETTFIPKINYMSMMFDSDSDCSMEINAMAMKYLKDEQLTQLSKLQTQSRLKGNKASKEHQRLAMLRRVLSDDKDSTPNVTTLGMSPNDMTFATRKYMERHGLLSDTDSASTASKDTYDDSYQLKVNFSMAPDSPAQITQEVVGTPSTRKSRSPFLDSLRSQNTSGKTRSTTLDSYQSPYNNKTASPLVNGNSRSSSRKTQSPLVHSYNTSGSNRTSVAQFTPSRGTPRLNRSDETSRTPASKDTVARVTPQHYISKDSGTESQNHITLQGSTPTDRDPGTPRGREQQYEYGRRIGSPPQDVLAQNQPRVLSPVIREVIPERPDNEAGYSTQQNRIHGLEEDDKILDITRLKLLPKLL